MWRRDINSTIHMAPTSLAEKRQDIALRLELPRGSHEDLMADEGEDWWAYARLIFGLEDTFGGEEKLLRYHRRRIQELPDVHTNFKHDQFRSWKAHVEKYVQALREMNAMAELESGHTYQLIFDKFSDELQDDFGTWFRMYFPLENKASLVYLVEWMGSKLSLWGDRTSSLRPPPKKTNNEKTARPDPKKNKYFIQLETSPPEQRRSDEQDIPSQTEEDGYLSDSTVQKMFAQYRRFPPKASEESKKDSADEWKCDICKEKHLLKNCPKYQAMTPKERSEMLMTNDRCFRCLRKGHRISKCQSKIMCRVPGCNKNHNSSLHGYREDHVVVKQLISGVPLGKVSDDDQRSHSSEDDGGDESKTKEEMVVLMNT